MSWTIDEMLYLLADLAERCQLYLVIGSKSTYLRSMNSATACFIPFNTPIEQFSLPEIWFHKGWSTRSEAVCSKKWLFNCFGGWTRSVNWRKGPAPTSSSRQVRLDKVPQRVRGANSSCCETWLKHVFWCCEKFPRFKFQSLLLSACAVFSASGWIWPRPDFRAIAR